MKSGNFVILLILLFHAKYSVAKNQYFIKISPSNNKVKFGKFTIKNYCTTYDYYSADNKVAMVSADKALQWINKEIGEENQDTTSKVLFFIHGFWGSLHYAVNMSAKNFDKYYLNNDSSGLVAIVHIIWDADNLSYGSTIVSLMNSRETLSSLLISIPETIEYKYSLMCHSMGARFLFETITRTKINTKFDELILMAPDLDYKKFQNNNTLFSRLANEVYIFFNTKDKTLLMSEKYNKVARLGRVNIFKNKGNIKFVDCSELDDVNNIIEKYNNHLYFLYSKKVRKKIKEILYI